MVKNNFINVNSNGERQNLWVEEQKDLGKKLEQEAMLEHRNPSITQSVDEVPEDLVEAFIDSEVKDRISNEYNDKSNNYTSHFYGHKKAIATVARKKYYDLERKYGYIGMHDGIDLGNKLSHDERIENIINERVEEKLKEDKI